MTMLNISMAASQTSQNGSGWHSSCWQLHLQAAQNVVVCLCNTEVLAIYAMCSFLWCCRSKAGWFNCCTGEIARRKAGLGVCVRLRPVRANAWALNAIAGHPSAIT